MGDDYYFVRMSEGALDEFAALAEDAVGVTPSRENDLRLFDTSAWGVEYLGFLARARRTDEVAAFYGIFPCFVEYNGRRYLAAQSGSTMTHSRHRKRGLFVATMKKTFELAQEQGIKFVYGFPNPNSYPGLMKAGWTHDGNLNAYHILVPTFPLSYLAAKFSLFEPLYRRWFRFVARRYRTDYQPFANSAGGTDAGFVCHDEALLRYRPETEERLMVKIAGTTVWINRQVGRVGIGDIDLCNGKANFREVLRGLKIFCFLTGSVHLRTYLSPGSPLDERFRERGYRPRQGIAICYADLGSGLPMEKFKFVYADFDTF